MNKTIRQQQLAYLAGVDGYVRSIFTGRIIGYGEVGPPWASEPQSPALALAEAAVQTAADRCAAIARDELAALVTLEGGK